MHELVLMPAKHSLGPPFWTASVILEFLKAGLTVERLFSALSECHAAKTAFIDLDEKFGPTLRRGSSLP